VTWCLHLNGSLVGEALDALIIYLLETTALAGGGDGNDGFWLDTPV